MLSVTTKEELFDPSSLKVEVKNTTISQLCEMLKANMIDLQPDFQRHGDLWSNAKQSRLIESIILGLPLPSFYFYIDEVKKQWVVIDGLQRLHSLECFMVNQTLRLHGLQFLSNSHQKKKFNDFSYFEQLRINMHPVTLNVISGEASAEAKYIIFQRLNSEGTRLSPAEIRNALFHGEAMDMVKELASSDQFKQATNHSVSEKRLVHLDYVSRFLSFYIQGYENYEGNKMDLFIGKALEHIEKDYSDSEKQSLKSAFFKSLSVCHQFLGDDAFRQPLTEEDKKNEDVKKNPVSLALFEATMCSIAKLSDEEIQRLLLQVALYRDNYADLFKDEFFKKKLMNGTNQYKSVAYRFVMLDDLVNKTLLM